MFRDKDVIDHFAARFATHVGGSPADFVATVKADIDSWGAIVRNAGIRAE